MSKTLTIAQPKLRMEDPHNCTDAKDVLAIFGALFDPLVSRAPNLDFTPALAESWQVDEDARTWTFHLRGGLRFHNGARGLDPRSDLRDRLLDGRRWVVDARVRHDGDKLVDAGPRDRPRARALGKAAERGRGPVVQLGVAPVRADEEVRVDGDHPPRSSYTASRMRSQPAPRNSSDSPRPSTDASRRPNASALRAGMLVAFRLILGLCFPQLEPIVASGFSPAKLELTRKLFYGLLPVIAAGGIASLWGSVLNAGERFVLVGLIPLATPAR